MAAPLAPASQPVILRAGPQAGHVTALQVKQLRVPHSTPWILGVWCTSKESASVNTDLENENFGEGVFAQIPAPSLEEISAFRSVNPDRGISPPDRRRCLRRLKRRNYDFLISGQRGNAAGVDAFVDAPRDPRRGS